MVKKPVTPSKAKSAPAAAVARLPVNQLHPIDGLAPANIIEARKINEIVSLLYLSEKLSEAERNARVVRAIELFESLQPADGAESMLAAQMVGVHFAALECLRRANQVGQTFEARESNLKHAFKLMALYTKQLDSLNKHRGKGQQKVTVEYVNVEAGGQAIVGHVDSPRRATGTGDQPAALQAPNELPLDVTPGRQPAKSKVRR